MVSASSELIELNKAYSRDTTLFMQGLWAKGLTQLAKEKFGWDNPYLPLVIHHVDDGVVEIWEHKKAIAWFLDRLLEKNVSGPEFLDQLLVEYKGLLDQLKKFHAKELISSVEDLRTYKDLVYRAAFAMTLFFYTGVDERNPVVSQEIAVKARKEGDFFAENDVFVRKSIAKMGGFSEESAGVVLPEETEKLPSDEILSKRLVSFLIIDGENPWLGTLEEFSNKNPQYIFEGLMNLQNVDEVQGRSAYPGVVRGIVRIVKKQSHMHKMAPGEILVAPMTTPDFLPAMKIASAFVTDEGGVTCHAAIVSRELNKPCVIGTKIATKVLHDGDEVEVDAEKGIVRIVKRA